MAGGSVDDGDDDDDGQKPILVASVHDVRYFASLLRTLNFSNRATVSAYEGGLIVSVEESRALLATAYIQSAIFDSFIYNAEPFPTTSSSSEPPTSTQSSAPTSQPPAQPQDIYAQFEVPLNPLLECLNIFGTAGPLPSSSNPQHKKWKKASSSADAGSDQDAAMDVDKGKLDQYLVGGGDSKGSGMRMTYVAPGHPLMLIIAEDATGPTTTCEITTFEAEPQIDMPFDNDEAVVRIIMKSSWLRDALSELDPSYEKLTFIVNPPPQAGRLRKDMASNPLFRIQAVGAYGSTEMDYPDDREVLESFKCEEAVKFSYRVSLITRTLKILQTSSKTSMRINEEGLLGFQFLVPPSRKECSEAYIDFRCLPLDDEA